MRTIIKILFCSWVFSGSCPILMSICLLLPGVGLGLGCNTAMAQQPAQPSIVPGLPVFNSAQGVVIFINNRGIRPSTASIRTAPASDSLVTRYTISRMETGNPRSAKNLGDVYVAPTPEVFRKIAGEEVWEQLRKRTKTKSDTEIGQYLQLHPSTDDYGFLSFNPFFRKAMGTAYIDEEVKNQKNKTYTYRMDIVGKNGVLGSITGEVTIGKAPDFLPPVTGSIKTKDSLVTIVWKQKVVGDIPYFAFIYRQSGAKGDFQKLSTRLLVQHKKDSIYYTFMEKVKGNSAYHYFIRPADILDNIGALPSDTASLIAANFRKLPMIAKLKAKDTLNAILLSWAPLSVNPLITGVEIQRSRDPRGDFVVIDTVSSLAHSYLDKRLLPHIAYYYRLCILHAGNQSPAEKFYTSVSADQQKTTRIPDAPYSLSVQTTSQGVRVAWQPVGDPDLYAYFVYRGTSSGSKMEVISPALTDTQFVDTATRLSRQTSYVYAVKAVSNGNNASAFSEKIAAHLPKGRERPVTPGGIRVIPRGSHLLVEWDDTRRYDPGIIGYILYRYPVGKPALLYDATKPASIEATRLQLSLVVNGAVTVPYFEDTIARSGQQYEYLVSAIDQYGAESGLSPTASYTGFNKVRQAPPTQVFARAIPEGVSLQWEQADSTGVQGFAIYRRTLTAKTPQKIATVKSTSNQYTDRQAPQGSLYIYTITTLTTAGETLPSDQRSVRK